MTVNQIIVMLDICRGFDETNHTGTLMADIDKLQKRGLIMFRQPRLDDVKEWELTGNGESLVAAWKAVADVAN